MPDTPRIVSVEDVQSAIFGAPPLPMRTDEIVWTRKAALRNAKWRHLTEAQRTIVHEGIFTYGTAFRYHAKLVTECGEPAGSGVCVTSGGRRGILTARHVLYADDEGKKRLPNPLIGFMPSQDIMLRELQRRGKSIGKGPLMFANMPMISIGSRQTVVPLQRPGKSCPDPGLPDIAIIAISNVDDFEKRLREAADEGTVTPEPEWLDLDAEQQVGIPHNIADSDEDKMLEGDWIVTGVKGERSNHWSGSK